MPRPLTSEEEEEDMHMGEERTEGASQVDSLSVKTQNSAKEII
jgi:hypothetical protein